MRMNWSHMIECTQCGWLTGWLVMFKMRVIPWDTLICFIRLSAKSFLILKNFTWMPDCFPQRGEAYRGYICLTVLVLLSRRSLCYMNCITFPCCLTFSKSGAYPVLLLTSETVQVRTDTEVLLTFWLDF